MSNINLPRKEFEAKLQQEFPNLYTDMYGDMRKTCMAWGIDTGPGWYDLIYDLSAKLEKLIVELPKQIEYEGEMVPCRPEYKAAQCKSKFAGLRFYMTGETTEMSKLIREYEIISEKTCEECGQPGKIVGRSWLYCACKDHANDDDKKHFEQEGEVK